MWLWLCCSASQFDGGAESTDAAAVNSVQSTPLNATVPDLEAGSISCTPPLAQPTRTPPRQPSVSVTAAASKPSLSQMSVASRTGGVMIPSSQDSQISVALSATTIGVAGRSKSNAGGASVVAASQIPSTPPAPRTTATAPSLSANATPPTQPQHQAVAPAPARVTRTPTGPRSPPPAASTNSTAAARLVTPPKSGVTARAEVSPAFDHHSHKSAAAAAHSQPVATPTADVDLSEVDSKAPPAPMPVPVIIHSSLQPAQVAEIMKAKSLLHPIPLVTSEYSKSVTHLVTRPKPLASHSQASGANSAAAAAGEPVLASRTTKYFLAVLSGVWVLDYRWIEHSLRDKRWADERLYEIKGDTSMGETLAPARAREARRLGRRLFDGLKFYLFGPFTAPPKGIDPTERETRLIIETGGGTVIDTLPEALDSPFDYDATPPNPEAGAGSATDQRPILPPVIVVCSSTATAEDVTSIHDRGLCPVQTVWLMHSVSQFKVLPLASFLTRPAEQTASAVAEDESEPADAEDEVGDDTDGSEHFPSTVDAAPTKNHK